MVSDDAISVHSASAGQLDLLSALMRDPNLIHLVGESRVVHGPIVMGWMVHAALQQAPPGHRLAGCSVRFLRPVVCDDVVEIHGRDGELEARVDGRVVAVAEARWARA